MTAVRTWCVRRGLVVPGPGGGVDDDLVAGAERRGADVSGTAVSTRVDPRGGSTHGSAVRGVEGGDESRGIGRAEPPGRAETRGAAGGVGLRTGATGTAAAGPPTTMGSPSEGEGRRSAPGVKLGGLPRSFVMRPPCPWSRLPAPRWYEGARRVSCRNTRERA
jgi:hypothetical protein